MNESPVFNFNQGKVHSYESTDEAGLPEKRLIDKIDELYNLTCKLISNYQSVTTGLFPRYSRNTSVGYVKDSIYCAIACWACSIAYKRLDDTRGRQTELCQTAVKTMRGILFCWMLQAEKLSNFKQNNEQQFALHARFNLETGAELSTPFLHLQMDLIALYILVLVQMTVSGAQIIYTSHEVAFLQNLVFYIERTYRTPDFGMWERGTRYNRGESELHSSSLGFVKAALEAVNGFNAYGRGGNSSSVIYVDIDGHNRNRTTFETLLPRESGSKNTDAALLLAIGWPAFATHNMKLFERTLSKCIHHLEGKYGLRRFLRDGYKTEYEDPTKLFYDEEETYHFRGIENQFPMFFAYISITALMKGNQALSNRYWQKFRNCLVESYELGILICPECYILDDERISMERAQPGTQDFSPLLPNESEGHHLWSNAIYVITLLLSIFRFFSALFLFLGDNLIHTTDLDPIYRQLPASLRPRNVPFSRHSAFQGQLEGNPVVQVALVSESVQLQTFLSTYGISTQTPHEIDPVQIWPSWRMVKVFENLGQDKKLGVSGRPLRPFGPLSTSKIFRLGGNTIITYPLLFELHDFYTNADPATLIEDIKRDIEFVAKRWKLAGRPTFCIVLREENVVGDYFESMLNLLVTLKGGIVNGVRVRIGRVHQLLSTGCVEHIDFTKEEVLDLSSFPIFTEIDSKTAHLKTKSSLRTLSGHERTTQEQDFYGLDDAALIQIISRDSADAIGLSSIAFAIVTMQKRYTPNYIILEETLSERMERVYRQACQLHDWWLIRYCAAICRKTVTSLAPSITNLLVRGKQVILGMKAYKEVTIGSPSTPLEIANAIFGGCPMNDQPQAAVFQQELIIACSDLISQKVDAFDGVLTIRLEWYTEAINMFLEFICDNVAKQKNPDQTKRTLVDLLCLLESSFPQSVIRKIKNQERVTAYDLPPTAVKEILASLMARWNWHLLSPRQIKRLNGSLNRVPINFYDRVWKILERVRQGIVIAGHVLPQNPTLKVLTQSELNFSYQVESMMSRISNAEYRQLLVELLCILATIMERNPEIYFDDAIDCDQLIKQAFNLFCDERRIRDRVDMVPFYDMDEGTLGSSTTAYLIRVVVDKLLHDSNIQKHKFNIHGKEWRLGGSVSGTFFGDLFIGTNSASSTGPTTPDPHSPHHHHHYRSRSSPTLEKRSVSADDSCRIT